MEKTKKILMVIFEIVFILIILYFILGYINYKNIFKGEDPLWVAEIKEYTNKDDKVTVYNNYIYKIVRHEIGNKKMTLELKLWFKED